MKSLESIYNSILLENQNPNNIDIKLLKKYVEGTYNINDDGSIDVNGEVNLGGRSLTEIPFKFRNVSGSFWCNSNPLTSLEGAPNNVGGIFNCSYNHLTSLEGSPITVDGSFRCINNQLTSLDGAPNKVNRNFICCNNPNLSYSELFKIVDKVKGDIYYSSINTPEDKDKIKRDRDIKGILKDNELGSLDV